MCAGDQRERSDGEKSSSIETREPLQEEGNEQTTLANLFKVSLQLTGNLQHVLVVLPPEASTFRQHTVCTSRGEAGLCGFRKTAEGDVLGYR